MYWNLSNLYSRNQAASRCANLNTTFNIYIYIFRQYFIGFGTSTITYVNHLRMIWLVVLVRSH